MTIAQYRIYKAIKEYINKKGYSPTVRELCKMTGKNRPGTVEDHLKKLKETGYITFIPNLSRTIRIIKVVDNIEQELFI